METKIKQCMNYIIKEYLNNKGMRNWFEGNMLYYKNRLNNNGTTKQAFAFVIQSPLSIFHLTKEEEQQVLRSIL